ncbi:MAG TPA: winged helix-turn-helix domain-containing protein [Actinomycetota bacterium]|nr:winged helix-turn-helix domain-containing protein [Actinomycetota bacterium]
MIIRVFRGQVHPGMHAEFERTLEEEGMPAFHRSPGMIAVHVGRPTEQSPDEFLVTTVWKDLDSLKNFAGERWFEPVIGADEAKTLRGAYVHHYEDPVGASLSGAAAADSVPNTAHVLLAGSASIDLPGVVSALRDRGLGSLIVGSGSSGIRLVSRWRPLVAVVAADVTGAEHLLRHLEQLEIPVVLIGRARELRLPDQIKNIEAGILAPAQPAEIAAAAEVVVGGLPIDDLPHVIDLGSVRLDVAARTALIEGHSVELPPKEFAVFVELALHAEVPVPVPDLARRAWPESVWTTGEDVRRTVYRLRKMIGDHDRSEPIIRNRRGYGYVLKPPA